MQRISGTVVDIQLDQAIIAANELSKIAEAEGDLPTMYAANDAWHLLFEARDDRGKRRLALANGDRGGAA